MIFPLIGGERGKLLCGRTADLQKEKEKQRSVVYEAEKEREQSQYEARIAVKYEGVIKRRAGKAAGQNWDKDEWMGIKSTGFTRQGTARGRKNGTAYIK